MATVRIDVDQVCVALDDHGPTTWFVDRSNGDVFPVSDGFGDDPEFSYDKVEEDPERYCEIIPIESRDGFALMEEFTLNLNEGEARRSLERALRMRKPFRCFKDTLADFGDVRDAWFEFHNTRIERLAHEFLKGEGLDYVVGLPSEDASKDDAPKP